MLSESEMTQKKTHLLLNVLSAIPLVLYYIIEDFILLFVPKRLRYKDIAGETVLITGAGCGIGRELSLEFANLKTRLILLDINKKSLQETKELIEKKYSTDLDVFLYECDVSNRKAVYSVAAKIKDEVGVVTILVNNAGIITGKCFMDCPDEMIQKTMEINTMAHFWTCKAFLPDMKAANHGHIVSVASIAGFLTAVGMADYCSSKYAAVGFDEALRLELEHEGYTGIKTTLIAPYFVKTGLLDGFDFPLVPGLNTTVVVKKIISGVLLNQEVVVIPGWIWLLVLAKLFIPRKAARHMSEASGLSNSMDNFRGRKKID